MPSRQRQAGVNEDTAETSVLRGLARLNRLSLIWLTQTFDPSRLQRIQIPYLCYSEFEDTITEARAFTTFPRVTGYSKGD